MIDLGGFLVKFSESCLSYRDLSVSGDVAEAARELFATLRWAEDVKDAALVLLPYVPSDMIEDLLKQTLIEGSRHVVSGGPDRGDEKMAGASAGGSLAPGLADRMFRAASGRFVELRVAGPPSSPLAAATEKI